MIQALAIIVIVVLVLLFVHYVLFEGDSIEGVKKVTYGCGFIGGAVLLAIVLVGLLILLVLAALGAFNH